MIKDNHEPEVWVILVHYDRKTWKSLDIQDKYSISSYGRVKNNYTGAFVAPQLTGNPAYWYVNLRPLTGKRKLVRIHLAMCYSFFGLSEDLKDTCDHIDQNRYNNSLWNFRWASKRTQTVNKGNTILVDGEALFLLGEKEGHTPRELYYIRSKLVGGMNYQEAKVLLSKYQERGGTYNKTVILDSGEDIDLWDWCTPKGLDYIKCVALLNRGWSLFQIEYNIPPIIFDSVFEYDGLCFPRRALLLNYLRVSERKYLELCNEGFSLDDIKQNRQEYLDRFKFNFQGFFMTKQDHCDRLGTSLGRVDTFIKRHSMSIEEALLTKPKRIIKHTINGITKRNSDWGRYYNIPSKRLNGHLSRHKCLKKTLEHFGVDTSDLEIIPHF